MIRAPFPFRTTMTKTLRTTIAALLSVLALGLAPSASAQDDGALRDAFRKALSDAREGRPALAEDSPALRRYLLYPYLEATRLQRALRERRDGSLDATLRRFIAANPDLSVTRELRRQWLFDLAARSDWAGFVAADVAEDNDPTLVCHRLNAHTVTGDEANVFAELRAYWMNAKQMPQACVAPFAWLQARGGIDEAATEARARKALSDGNAAFAGTLINGLPAERAAPLRRWQLLIDDPARSLPALAADRTQPFEIEALQAAVDRLSRRDSRAAAQWLASFEASRVTVEQYATLMRSVALGLAWDRHPEALAYFQSMPESASDDRVYEWRLRAALWNGQWKLVTQWLALLPPAMSAEPRWNYWRARAAERLSGGAQAKPLYAQLARENGYYGVLAAWRADLPYQPKQRALPEDAEIQRRLQVVPALQRARELFYVGEIPWATAEWRTATRDLPVPELQQAAHLASRWGWHWQTVVILNQTNATDVLGLLYPQAYMAEIARGAAQAQLPPAWIYGVMRQESLFLPTAQSAAPAYGLLQLLLPTARDVARKIGAPRPDINDLFDPSTNVRLGSAYLRQMTDRFGGQFVLTLASYNAGPNAVARWLPDQPMEADVWIENVPFNETRGYVQRILWHITVHTWQLGADPHDLDTLLPPVRRPVSG